MSSLFSDLIQKMCFYSKYVIYVYILKEKYRGRDGDDGWHGEWKWLEPY